MYSLLSAKRWDSSEKHIIYIDHFMNKLTWVFFIKYRITFFAITYVYLALMHKGKEMNFVKF